MAGLLRRWRCRHCDTWNGRRDIRCHCCGKR
jgi:hypothetical protein